MWGKNQSVVFTNVCDALNKNNVEWLVLRNYEGLPEHNRSKDLDLGVKHADFDTVYKIVANELKTIGYRKVFKIRYQYAVCATFFYKDDQKMDSIKIDLVDGFVWRGAQVVSFSDIYERRKKYKNFYVPSETDDAFMLLIKPLMTGGFIKEKYVPDIVASIQRNDAEFSALYLSAFGNKFYRNTWEYVVQNKFEELVKYKKQMCYEAWKICFMHHPVSTIAKLIEHIYLEIGRCIIRKKATMISIVGPDGVGKSTFLSVFIEKLADLCVCDAKDIQVFHFRPNLLPNIKKLIGGKNYDESKEDFSNPHRGRKTSFISSFVRMVYYWVDYVVGYYVKIKLKCRHNGKVIFDRYSSDYLVDPERSRVFLPYMLRKLFVNLTPQTDIAYVLACDAEIVYKRKKELTLNEIQDIMDAYDKVIREHKNYFKLDASLSPDEIGNTACRLYIDMLDDI